MISDRHSLPLAVKYMYNQNLNDELSTGYAYFYGQPAMQNLAQAAYGYNPAAAAMSVPTTATQFQQKAAYGSSYGNYDAIGQPGGAGKDFASSYSATNAVAAAAAAAAKKPGSSSGTGQGELRWAFKSLVPNATRFFRVIVTGVQFRKLS